MTLPLILITVSLLATVLHFHYRFQRTPQLAKAILSHKASMDELDAEGMHLSSRGYYQAMCDAYIVHAGCQRFTALTLRFGLVLSSIAVVLLLIELAEVLGHGH